MLKSLQAKDSPLSQTEKQLEILSGEFLKMMVLCQLFCQQN
jgi:hypothetical protein